MPGIKKIKLDILPLDARRALLDFYDFLVSKYGKSGENNKTNERVNKELKGKKIFFDSVEKHSFKLPKDYKFDREELHER